MVQDPAAKADDRRDFFRVSSYPMGRHMYHVGVPMIISSRLTIKPNFL
jgi:hypothetical protein